MAKAIMIQGTGSGVGKRVIVAGLCRIFRDLGIKVAPFKSQNMALNSFITIDGGEIGRAQAFQAEAAGIEPSNDMNPVLLKAASESGCQVIINGKIYANMNAAECIDIKAKAWEAVTAAYDRLSNQYDLIVIEGAGSPAEINLRKEEIVNMKVARYADAPVILVGNIDKGGVFASFYGTVELLKDPAGEHDDTYSDADFIKAFIVNKFRGDRDILRPGLRMIEKKTGKLVIGTIDYTGDLGLHEEDAIPEERLIPRYRNDFHKPIKIVVIALRYITNFTDFDPFMYEDDVEIKYSLDESDINSADLIIIPGSKNTVSDLLYLRENGIETAVKAAVKNGTSLLGICGGYQMLGNKILDPFSVESSRKEINGMSLLDIMTTLDKTKTTSRLSASITSSKWFDAVQSASNCRWNNLRGYEIHVGNTTGDIGLFKLKRLQNTDKNSNQDSLGSGLCNLGSEVMDGSAKDNVWGTYIHGIFDNNGLRTALINSLRMKKGLQPRESTINYAAEKEKAIDRWADILKSKVDICYMLRQVGMDACMKNFTKGLKCRTKKL
ncbi:MAG: cobyric acid synthase [Nitrospiraceae bacterium]|nr:MAG: cobyric acid synthase [Nitrospiraceae bacterium]